MTSRLWLPRRSSRPASTRSTTGGRAYAERLVADDVTVTYVDFEDMINGFVTNLSSPKLDRAVEAVDVVADGLP